MFVIHEEAKSIVACYSGWVLHIDWDDKIDDRWATGDRPLAEVGLEFKFRRAFVQGVASFFRSESRHMRLGQALSG